MDTSKLKEIFLSKKIFFAVAGIVLLAEIFWAWQTYFKQTIPPPSSAPGATSSTVKLASISLSSAKTNFKAGEKVEVAINISSTKATDGTDVILNYDPNILSVVDNVAGQPVKTGTIYQDYPQNSVDATRGKVSVSGITSAAGGVIPKGEFGRVVFQTLKAAKTTISVQFQKGNTADSNIVETGTAKDLLGEVKNLSLDIAP